MRSCLVVLVGKETSERKWVKYEIEKAMELNKGIVGIRINKLKDCSGKQDSEGSNPFIISLRVTVIACLIMLHCMTHLIIQVHMYMMISKKI